MKIPIKCYEKVLPSDTMVEDPANAEPVELVNEGGTLYKVTII